MRISAAMSIIISHSRKSDFLFWRISWRKRILCCKKRNKMSKTTIKTKNCHCLRQDITSTNFNLKSRLANLWVNSNSSLRYSQIWAYLASFHAMSDLKKTSKIIKHKIPEIMADLVKCFKKYSNWERIWFAKNIIAHPVKNSNNR